MLKQLIRMISEKNPLQEKSLNALYHGLLEEEEKREISQVISFYLEQYTMEEITDAYLLFLEDTLKETKYYIETGGYRYSSFQEVAEHVYYNSDYMTNYMIGLSLSGYLWTSHLKLYRFFKSVLAEASGDSYLEIGPGHGRYFCNALQLQKFKQYLAVDLSETSISQTRQFVERFKSPGFSNYQVLCQDFYGFDTSSRFDMIVAAEVLEHLEQPFMMLQKIHQVCKENGSIYVTVPINSPAVDHIYHFKTIEEVEHMITDQGFDIKKTCYVPANDIPLEKAVRKKQSIIVGIYARRRQ